MKKFLTSDFESFKLKFTTAHDPRGSTMAKYNISLDDYPLEESIAMVLAIHDVQARLTSTQPMFQILQESYPKIEAKNLLSVCCNEKENFEHFWQTTYCQLPNLELSKEQVATAIKDFIIEVRELQPFKMDKAKELVKYCRHQLAMKALMDRLMSWDETLAKFIKSIDQVDKESILRYQYQPGMVTSLVNFYRRENENDKIEERLSEIRGKSQQIGDLKKRVNLTVDVLKVIHVRPKTYDSAPYNVVQFIHDDTNLGFFFIAPERMPDVVKPGNFVKIRATVQDYKADSRNDIMTTKLNRVVFQ